MKWFGNADRVARWLCILLLFPLSALAQTLPLRVVAVTFDDLPFASVPSDDPATLSRLHTQLTSALHSRQVPAVGFVNEAKLYREGELDPARVALLRDWLHHGFELGNHTYSHVSLNRVARDAFEADLLRGETVTRPLAQAEGKPLRWFRHPFLHVGKTAEVRAAFAGFLQAHGYTPAPVTVNNSEWIFAVAYARALAANDAEAAQIGEAYLAHMDASFTRIEQLAFDLLGRPMSHVLVLHANMLNADYFSRLADLLRQRGYRFVTLDEALADPAYHQPLGDTAHEGESWLEGWARQAGLRPYAQAPVPAFVTRWAGAAAYRGY